jgi:hypothetical protein
VHIDFSSLTYYSTKGLLHVATYRWLAFVAIAKNVTLSKEERIRERESRRLEIFNESAAQQHQQTREEETRQAENERVRDAEFETSMMALQETFHRNERSRERAFRDAELEQEKMANRNEDSRARRFELANNRRDALFQEECDARQKRSEWYTDIRERHIRQGHNSRQMVFHNLETQLQDQISGCYHTLKQFYTPNVDGEEGKTVSRLLRQKYLWLKRMIRS